MLRQVEFVERFKGGRNRREVTNNVFTISLFHPVPTAGGPHSSPKSLTSSSSSVSSSASSSILPDPGFVGQLKNETVPEGRDVALVCTVKNLGQHKVLLMQQRTNCRIPRWRTLWYSNYRAIFPVVLEVRRRMFCFGGWERAQNMRRRTSKTTGKIARYCKKVIRTVLNFIPSQSSKGMIPYKAKSEFLKQSKAM